MSSCVFMARSLGRDAQRVGGVKTDHGERGLDPLRGAVLEPYLRVDVDVRPSGIDRTDDVAVFVGNDVAADLAGARQLAVVGIELLIKKQKLGDALARR